MLINEFTKGSNSSFSIIKESSLHSQPENVKKYTDGKVIFEAYLQEAESKNKNGRFYPKKVLNEGIVNIKPRIKQRSLVGELDHPISDDQIRQTTVLYSRMSHIIRELGWENNLLKGVIESTPYSENGKTLSGLVLDKVSVGFSMRGLADLDVQNNVQTVQSPLTIITFDSVSEPSHDKAVVQEVRTENTVSVVKESNNLVCTEDGKCYLKDHFDYLLESKIIKLHERMI